MLKDFEKVRKVHETFEQKYNTLVTKFENQMKENMLTKLENSRYKEKVNHLQVQIEKLEKQANVELNDLMQNKDLTKNPKVEKATPFPAERENPWQNQEIEKFSIRDGTSLFKTFKGHTLGISKICVHPKKPVLATASDDNTWKLWNIPDGK